MAYISLTCSPGRWLVSEGGAEGRVKVKSTHRLKVFQLTVTLIRKTHRYLYFAACGGGSTLLLSIEVFWKQNPDEGTARRREATS